MGVASIDLSTGEFRATEFGGAHAWALACDELARMRPAEMSVAARRRVRWRLAEPQGSFHLAPPKMELPESQTEDSPRRTLADARTELEEWAFTEDYAVPLLRQQLKRALAGRHGIGQAMRGGCRPRARLCTTCARPNRARSNISTRCAYYEQRDSLELDAVSVRNLELVEPLFSERRPADDPALDAGCMLHADGQASAALATAAAACSRSTRSTRGWMRSRWRSGDLRRREGLRRAMDGVLDLERLLGRVALDSAGPREVVALGVTLGAAPGRARGVAECAPDATRWASWQARSTR